MTLLKHYAASQPPTLWVIYFHFHYVDIWWAIFIFADAIDIYAADTHITQKHCDIIFISSLFHFQSYATHFDESLRALS